MAQAPANSPALGMGRPLFDRSSFGPDTPPEVVEAMMALQNVMIGMGWVCGAHDGDEKYQNVVAQYDGSLWNLFAGRPDAPLNPDAISISSGGSAIIVELDNSVVHAAATVLNFSTNFSVVDAGSGQVDIDVTGGGGSTNAFGTITVDGQSDVVADAAPDSVEFEAGTAIVITTSAVGDRVTWAVDFTAIADHDPGADQYLRNNNGTFEWAILPADNDTTYTAGAGVNLSGTKFVADPHTASHVGLVDPSTGDDSSADNAQIGVLWHAIEGFDNGRNQLHGHVADDSSKPKITCKTTEDWLEILEGYTSANRQVIGNKPDNDGTEGNERVRWIDSPQKVIWGIDPDGGHTIETSGTTLTLTLKVTKYTFDAVNFESAVDDEVEIVYSTGTECT